MKKNIVFVTFLFLLAKSVAQNYYPLNFKTQFSKSLIGEGLDFSIVKHNFARLQHVKQDFALSKYQTSSLSFEKQELAFQNRTAPLDLRPFSIVTPSGICLGSGSPVTVGVNVENVGSNPINFSINNATITVSMTGSGNGIATATITSGTLQVGAIQTVFLSPLIMTDNGIYTLTASCALVGDGDPTNDVLIPSTNFSNAGIVIPISSGNWSDPNIWCGGVIPSSTSKVKITRNKFVTVDIPNAFADSLGIDQQAGLTISAGNKLQVGPVCGGNREVSCFGGLTILGELYIGGSLFLPPLTFASIYPGGSLTVDPNDGTAAGSVVAGKDIISGNGFFRSEGGTITIVDPPFTGNGKVINFNSTTTVAVSGFVNTTLILGGNNSSPCLNTSTATNGFETNTYYNSFGTTFTIFLGDVVVNGGAGGLGNRWFTPGTSSTNNGTLIKGNLTINPNSEIRQSAITNFEVRGDIINNGTITQTAGEIRLAKDQSTISQPQILGGSGTWQNAQSGASANLTGLRVMNTNSGGVTLNIPLTIADYLTLSSGIIRTGSNTLTLGRSPSLPGTLLRGTGWIEGNFKRWFGTNTTSLNNTNSLLLVGTNTNPRPAHVIFTTPPTSGGTLTASFNSSAPTSNGLPLLDGVYSLDQVANIGYWSITAADGLSGGTYDLQVKATGIPEYFRQDRLRIIKRSNNTQPWTVNGTHFAGFLDTTRRSGMNGFSEFGIASNLIDNPLPIYIQYLHGTKQSNNHILEWKVNCVRSPRATMVLERTDNGQLFKSIHSITADAVRCQQAFYFTDVAPLSGLNHYRLKMIDADGGVTYSSTVVLLNKLSGIEIVNMLPSLVKENTVLNIASAENTKIKIVITDIVGKQLMTKEINLIAGSNQVQLDFSNFSSGIYQLSGYANETKLKTIRFVKQ